MPILGLGSSAQIASYNTNKNRRSILHNYPQGTAPLVALLSLLPDEVTDTTDPGWWEKRYLDRLSKTGQFQSVGPFAAAGSGTGLTSPATITQGTAYRVKLATGGVDAARIRKDHVVMIKGVSPASGAKVDIKGLVTTIVDATHFEMQIITATGSFLMTSANVGLDVMVIGSAYAEGQTINKGIQGSIPVNPANSTQIFRDPFSFTRTALQLGLDFDKTGPYKERSKEAALEHATSIEKAVLWGERRTELVNGDDGESLPRRYMGGLLWYLRQWELGNVANGGAFDYRPGGSAATANTDENKRIIDVSGVLSRDGFESYLQRPFEMSNNKSNEKLVLCGSGVLSRLNKVYEGLVVTHRLTGTIKKSGEGEGDMYGMDLRGISTPFGTIWLKTHPLFKGPQVNDALVIDLPNLKWRPYTNADTQLLKNRQPNDADYRKDEWLTEATVEVRYPESHMYLQNITGMTI